MLQVNYSSSSREDANIYITILLQPLSDLSALNLPFSWIEQLLYCIHRRRHQLALISSPRGRELWLLALMRYSGGIYRQLPLRFRTNQRVRSMCRLHTLSSHTWRRARGASTAGKMTWNASVTGCCWRAAFISGTLLHRNCKLRLIAVVRVACAIHNQRVYFLFVRRPRK